MTPTELVNAILKAPVDLLYNGGIGTYVKASERDARAGRRSRQRRACASTAASCAARWSAEGGNLGCTQLGRIEYALAGGRINTDAIDNSAGVDTSDHEVNIKMLLGLPIAEGELTEKQRNALLAEMTDEVAALVLRDNYFQTQVLSVTGRIGRELLDAQQRFIQYLEKSGRLNRAIEYLPSDEEIAERRLAAKGLTSPERAVLLAYSKIWLFDELARLDAARRSVGGERARPLFPERAARALRGLHDAPPAQARDHRHPRRRTACSIASAARSSIAWWNHRRAVRTRSSARIC